MSKRRRYFDDLPGVKAPRANFNLSHRVVTTMKPGLLHPIKVVEVLSGDTWTVDSAQLVKLVTPLVRPIMDDVYLDTYSFFVPLRLCYDKLEDVFGDSSPSAYESQDLAVIPSFTISTESSASSAPPSGTVYDYLGVTSDVVQIGQGTPYAANYSVLPARAFALVWNEFFRNQQVDQEVAVNLSGVTSDAERPSSLAWSPTNYGGKLPPVRRYGDYFSTAMLAPQKGPAVKIPISGTPLLAKDNLYNVGSIKFGAESYTDSPTGMLKVEGGALASTSDAETTAYLLNRTNLVVGDSSDGTINALRTAFQLQKYLERDAFYGSRYREYLYASYGVVSQDARIQVPEFLGGTHNRLQISQIMSTASTDTVAQGQFAGQISSLSEKNLRFLSRYLSTVILLRLPLFGINICIRRQFKNCGSVFAVRISMISCFLILVKRRLGWKNLSV